MMDWVRISIGAITGGFVAKKKYFLVIKNRTCAL